MLLKGNHLDLIEPRLPRFGEMVRLFEKEDNPSSFWLGQLLVEKRLLRMDDAIVTPMSALYYSVLRCQPHRPLWHLDTEVVDLLQRQLVPLDYVASRLPVMPYEGLYVTLPQGALEMTGVTIDKNRRVKHIKDVYYEGFYLCEDWFFDHNAEFRPAITLTAVSYAQRPHEAYFYSLTIPSGENEEGKPYVWDVERLLWSSDIGGKPQIFGIAMGLLLALEGRYLQEEERGETRQYKRGQGSSPSRKYNALPYTIIHLTQQGRRDLLSNQAEAEHEERKKIYGGTGVIPCAHLRREHEHSYWVRDPGSDVILGRRMREDGVWLYRVHRTIDEIKVGEGPVKRPLALVKR